MKRFLPVIALLPILLFAKKKKDRDTSAVILQPNRIEFELARDASEFFVVSGEENGIMVVEETKVGVKPRGSLWKVHLVDTTLKINWTKNIVLPPDGSLIGFEYSDKNFYFLFTKDKFRTEDLLVYKIGTDSSDIITHEITTVFPVQISHFEALGETILLAGYSNFRPVVITYDLNDRVPRVVPGFYDNRNNLLDLVIDDESRLFTVVMSERMKSKKFTVRVKTFTEKGDLIQDNLIDPGEKKSLLDAASTTFAGGLQYLAGSHSKKSPQYSQGFYLSKFVNGQQQFNKYYPFAELSNFFEHLKPKREKRIKNRIARKRERGKTKRFSYRLLIHEILERDGEYIMIGEAYYPRYNYSSSGSSFGPNNTAFSPGFSNPFFLGYKYTHAVVVAFDPNCNLLWDHTFKIEDIQTYTLDENVVVSASSEGVILMYLEENEIRSKVVKGNEVVEGRTFNPVRLSFESDELRNKNPNVEGLERWYDETLFAYGEHSIQNPNKVAGRTFRKVFYINKVQYNINKEPN